jgi:hypothetical protein
MPDPRVLDPERVAPAVRAAVVLRPGTGSAEVCFGGHTASVGYAAPFAPRAESLTPGHLVAVVITAQTRPLVIWRWYDAVVLEQVGQQVRLWEPGHGEVLARSRDDRHQRSPGTRAYASAGLPGAQWWVEGPVGPVEQADVAMAEVLAFYTALDLWSRLT